MFYTYLWLRENGTPYYVGKGHGNRAFVRDGHRTNVPPKERIVLYPAESEFDAFETEIALIWYYGRKDLGTGILRNYTSGGEGFCGGRHSEEWIDQTKTRMKGNKFGIGHKARLGIPHTEFTKIKISNTKMGTVAWNKGKELSEAHRLSLSSSHKGNKHSEETKRKMSDSHWQRQHVHIL